LDLNIEYFIITAIFFIIGFLISYLLKSKHVLHQPLPPSSKVDYSEIIDVLENRKQLQIDTITHKINDIQIKLDLVESVLSQVSKTSYTDTNITNSHKNITEKPKITSQSLHSSDIPREIYPKISQQNINNSKHIDLTDKQNATNYYILKILLKESLTSNEIKNAIGRTREHTARLMKKLYDLKFVDRDVTTKPFKYRLTEQGKKYIEEHIEENDFKSSSASIHNTLFDLTR
jgi:CTP-dependent riboflavin kinase